MSIIGKKFEKHNRQILEHNRHRPNADALFVKILTFDPAIQ